MDKVFKSYMKASDKGLLEERSPKWEFFDAQSYQGAQNLEAIGLNPLDRKYFTGTSRESKESA